MRETYLTPFLGMKIGLNNSRKWPKSGKNLVDPKFDEAERKVIKKGVLKNARASFLVILALN